MALSAWALEGRLEVNTPPLMTRTTLREAQATTRAKSPTSMSCAAQLGEAKIAAHGLGSRQSGKMPPPPSYGLLLGMDAKTRSCTTAGLLPRVTAMRKPHRPRPLFPPTDDDMKSPRGDRSGRRSSTARKSPPTSMRVKKKTRSPLSPTSGRYRAELSSRDRWKHEVRRARDPSLGLHRCRPSFLRRVARGLLGWLVRTILGELLAPVRAWAVAAMGSWLLPIALGVVSQIVATILGQ